MSRLQVPRTLVNRLLQHAQRAPASEVCGLIGASNGRPNSLYPIANVAGDPARLFLMDARGQFDALRAMETNGERLWAIYHSHPAGPATPSDKDVAESAYPDALYLIVSLGIEGVLELRGFKIADGAYREIEIGL